MLENGFRQNIFIDKLKNTAPEVLDTTETGLEKLEDKE